MTLSVILVLGVGIRFAAISIAPQRSYLPDHLDALAWGTYAYRNGPVAVYDMTVHQPIFVYESKHPKELKLYFSAHGFNYPPLSAYLFCFQSWVWHHLEQHPITLPSDRESAAQFAKVGVDRKYKWLRAWTWNALFASAAPTIPFDVLLAFAILWLVRAVRAHDRSSVWEIFAFATTLLAPAIFLNSSFWNQYEAWVACPVVLSIVMLLNRRHAIAGAFFAIALMLKTSALLFAPAIAYALFLDAITHRERLSLILRRQSSFAVCLGAVAALSALPFVIRDYQANKGDWPTRWLTKSYFATLDSDAYPKTTLSAFNIWWIDYLWQGAAPSGKSSISPFDPKAKFLGIEKDSLGRLLLITAMVAGLWLCGLRPARPANAALMFGSLVLMAAFVLPTRVHERYVYFCIPLLIAMAAVEKRWIWPMIGAVLVGSFEMTSYSWTSANDLKGALSLPRLASLILSCLSVAMLMTGFVLAATNRFRPRRESFGLGNESLAGERPTAV